MGSTGDAGRRRGMRVAFGSLGCKLNQAETEYLARESVHEGFQVVSASEEADIYILNTCTVTHVADRKSRHWLRLAHSRNPDAILVATGCYAQRASKELAQIEGVSLILDNREKPNLLQEVKRSCSADSLACSRGDPIRPHDAAFRTRAFIKVQDGCNGFCSYCIVPIVRGREKSLPLEQVVIEINARAVDKYKEVVLTGVKVGSYKYGDVNFKELLERIMAETNIAKLRISSLEPQEIYPELLALWRDSRLCHHFHLSLQSGSDAVLRRMRRPYTTNEYQQSVSLIRSMVPEAAITTDIIVGFPGETETEFQESFDFCHQIAFAQIHVFPYSPRQETPAAQMPRPVAQEVKNRRVKRMLALAKESAQKFTQQFLGNTMTVLWEKEAYGVWSGLTDNYIRVYTESAVDLVNTLLPVRLVSVYRDGVWGEIGGR